MNRRSIGSVLAAAAMVASTGVALAAPGDGGVQAQAKPPNTLTKAEYVMTGGTTGELDLADKGAAALVPGEQPIVVSLGDSYISGEDGRWAGNVDWPSRYEYSDALGEKAYLDLGTAEAIPACHRSQSAPIHFGKGVTSINLACSGAVTKTNASEKPFKPGIDFADTTLKGGARAEGQAQLLKNLALSNEKGRIQLVTLSIGGNDFKFAGIVKTCLTQYMLAGTPCSRVDDVTNLFSAQNIKAQREAIAGAMANVVKAMTDAGYTDDDWTLLVQTYPSPIAGSKTIRYKENYDRQFEGGCGMYNKDLDWANDYALYQINETVKYAVLDNRALGSTNVKVLDLAKALLGHRLCEQNTVLVGRTGTWGKWSPIRNWKQANAVDNSEWVGQIRMSGNWGLAKPFVLEESLHPDYWAQKGYQNCMRQAYNGGKIRGGICVYGGTGLNADGLPWLELDPSVPFSVGKDQIGASSSQSPGKVRRIRANRTGPSYLVRWAVPSDPDKVEAYLYRFRSNDRRWSGWINYGYAQAVRLVGLPKGATRVQVVAQNQFGAGEVARVRFKVAKRG